MPKSYNRLLLAAFMGLATTGIVGVSGFDDAEAANRLIRRCTVQGDNDTSMTARFERRSNGRKKFTVEMEAAPGGSLSEGQTVVFVVGGVRVGSDQLQTVVGGDLVGELNFDTNAGPGDDEDPFPQNFPRVSKGTQVAVKSGGNLILACALR